MRREALGMQLRLSHERINLASEREAASVAAEIDWPAWRGNVVIGDSDHGLPTTETGTEPMPKLDDRNIEQDSTRCGGQPVVGGTRIRLGIILGCYRQGMSVEEIVQQYPSLKPADVHDALAYASDHLDEIETDLAADDEATVKAWIVGGTSQ